MPARDLPDFVWEYRSRNFYSKFSCNHNMLGISSVRCPLNGVSLGIGRLAKTRKAGCEVDFPDRSSVLRRSGDLSQNKISTAAKGKIHD
jgi:hypothetical protein